MLSLSSDIDKSSRDGRDDTNAVLQDRAFVEHMKADILRWAEAMSDDEEEDDSTKAGGISKGVDVAFEDELDDGGVVKVRDGQSEDEVDLEADDGDDKVNRLSILSRHALTEVPCRSCRCLLSRRLPLSLRIYGIQNSSRGMLRQGGVKLDRTLKLRQVCSYIASLTTPDDWHFYRLER